MPARCLRGALVHVVQAAQDRARTDAARGGAGGGIRSFQPEAPMRALGVVITAPAFQRASANIGLTEVIKYEPVIIERSTEWMHERELLGRDPYR